MCGKAFCMQGIHARIDVFFKSGMIVEGQFTPIHTAGRTERKHRPGVEQDYEQGQSLCVT